MKLNNTPITNMDAWTNLEYLCRVCAVNTRGKNSVAECVYILKTPTLKTKIEKYFYLKVNETDPLPKILCKSCFRQVEATASLSNIGKHTQKVFEDFIIGNFPKPMPNINASKLEYTTLDLVVNNEEQGKCDKTNGETNDEPLSLTANNSSSMTNTTQVQSSDSNRSTNNCKARDSDGRRKGDVVVNVSIDDPLTQDNQSMVISNSQRLQNYSDLKFTPKSIAQKSILTMPNISQSGIAQKSTGNAVAIPFNSMEKPPSAVNNCSHNASVTAAGIGLTSSSMMATNNTNGGGISVKISRRRKQSPRGSANCFKTPNGQMSLLKSSCQKQQYPIGELNTSTKYSNEVNNGLNTLMIQAVNRNSTSNATCQSQGQTGRPLQIFKTSMFPDDILLGKVIKDMDLLKLILKALKWPVNSETEELQIQRLRNSKFSEVMSDPNLLQDNDLTQLLGPYLAPVLMAAHALQQQQQQQQQQHRQHQQQQQQFFNTMPDGNVASSICSTINSDMNSKGNNDINSAIPYRLPPETSVQLLPPVTTEEIRKPYQESSIKLPTTLPQKRQRRNYNRNPKNLQSTSLDAGKIDVNLQGQIYAQQSLVDLANWGSHFINQVTGGDLLVNNTNREVVQSLVDRQRIEYLAQSKKIRLATRKKNNVCNNATQSSNEFDALIDIDDDIEVINSNDTDTDCRQADAILSASIEQREQNNSLDGIFKQPNEKSIINPPIITRPIIKRRKTVIQNTAKAKLAVNNGINNDSDLKISTDEENFNDNNNSRISETMTVPVAPADLIGDDNDDSMDDVIISTQCCSTDKLNNIESSIDDDVEKKENVTPPSTNNAPVVKIAENMKNHRSKSGNNNKSALGQQLLEAVGLQKISVEETTTIVEDVQVVTLPPSSEGGEEHSQPKEVVKPMNEHSNSNEAPSSSNKVEDVVESKDDSSKKEMENNKKDQEDTSNEMEEAPEKSPSQENSEQKEHEEDLVEKPLKKFSVPVTLASKNVSEKKRLRLTRTATPILTKVELVTSSTGGNNEATPVNTDKKSDETVEGEESTQPSSSTNKTEPKVEENTAQGVEIVPQPRRRGRKRKSEKITTEPETKKPENNPSSEHPETEKSTNNNTRMVGRPTRQSKILSKYYKVPDRAPIVTRAKVSKATKPR